MPLGQRISMEAILVSCPKPKVHALVAGGHESDTDGDMVVEHAAGSRGQLDFRADGIAALLWPVRLSISQ